MHTLLQDLRFGMRMLLKQPGFTVVAILTLAIGIGINTAMFSVVNAVLLRPLSYQEPERLVRLWGASSSQGGQKTSSTPTEFGNSFNDFLDWKAQNRVFKNIAVISFGTVALTGRDEPLRLRCPVVSADFFAVLEAKPLLGRFFLPEEDQVGKHRVAVLSYGLWQRLFAAEPKVIGQTLTLNGDSFTVIGVAPQNFEHPILNAAGEPDLWRPIAIQPEARSRGAHFLNAIARLKPGVSVEQAQSEMNNITGQLERQYPESNTGRGVRLTSLHSAIVGNIQTALYVLLGAVGFVLLIACVNVANLFLARASARQKEIAIRLALGAGRLRIIRQLLTESVLISLVGGAGGFLLAFWSTDLLLTLSAGDVPRLQAIKVDASVLAFTFVISLATGIIFGLAPALQLSKPNLNSSLKDGVKSTASSPGRQRFRRLLLISEVALSLVLLIGAGLLLKSFWQLQQVKLGFNPEGLLTMDLSLPRARYSRAGQAAAFQQQLLEKLRALPGVNAVGVVDYLPLSGRNTCDGFTIEGRPPLPPGEFPCSEMRSSSTDYLRTLDIPLIRGRQFTDQDREGTPLVVLINESMARRFFPHEDPIGKRVNLEYPNQVWREVVGIVRDVKHFGLASEAQPEIYRPQAQAPTLSMSVLVRSASDPASLAALLRKEVRALDKDLPVYNLREMRDLVKNSVAQPRFRTFLLGIFAAVALLLASVGIYGVMSYAVNQSTRELGIRLALGAQRRDIFGLVMGQGLILAAIGIVIGLAASVALTRFLSSLLFGVSPTDLFTFAGISILLAAIALLACYLPARRATRVDPMVALRYE